MTLSMSVHSPLQGCQEQLEAQQQFLAAVSQQSALTLYYQAGKWYLLQKALPLVPVLQASSAGISMYCCMLWLYSQVEVQA